MNAHTSSLKTILFLFFLLGLTIGQAQEDDLHLLPEGVSKSEYRYREASGGEVAQLRVHPPSWWVGMQHSTLQVLIYDKEISDFAVEVNHPGVTVQKVHRVENPNYLFVDLEIGPGTQPGTFPIVLTKGDTQQTYPYKLEAKPTDPTTMQGLDASDLIYLIMPDRFANGDAGNDVFKGMKETTLDRTKIPFRHGGDLIGVMQHLDYLEDLGVTALWLNPVLENDQPYHSYHGYAITDHYLVDPRMGTNEQYRQLVKLCHERGIKVIMDIVHNHVGDEHWFIQDLPSEDWIFQGEAYEGTMYRATVHMDPYASNDDQRRVKEGWFDNHMPDLNHKNPFLANYLIQNHIWWTAWSGHDAYRIDTYAYCDQDFMAEWGRRMQEEFPDFNFFGETWVHGIGVQAQFTQNNQLREGYNSYLPGVTDYQIYYAALEALAGKQGWTDGVTRIYYTLAQDFLYEDPFRNVLFLDNHDLSRLYSVMGEDNNRYEAALAFLATTRGIPMIYYGTEIKMTGGGGAFGEGGRVDFQGGWPQDTISKFTPEGRTQVEQAAFDYSKKLFNYRKNTPALHHGKLTQFAPENGIYVYFRHDATHTIMVIMNSTEEAVNVPTTRYQERMAGFSRATNVVTGETLEDLSTIRLERNSALVLELKP